MKEQYWERMVIQTKGDSQNYHIGFAVTDSENNLSDPIRGNFYILENCFYGIDKEKLQEYIVHHRDIMKAGKSPEEEKELERLNFRLKGIKVTPGKPSEIPLEEIVSKSQIDPTATIIVK